MFITLTRYSNDKPVVINVDQVLQVHELEHQQGERTATAVYVGPNGANGDAGPVVVTESLEKIRELLGTYLSPRSLNAVTWRRGVDWMTCFASIDRNKLSQRQSEVRDLLDLLTDTTIADTLKAGKIARVPVGRVGNKVLFLMLDKDNATGEIEVSSEWSVYAAN